jgi:exodeoxyribonuclease VII large subunit
LLLSAHLRPQALQNEIVKKQDRLLELQARLAVAALRAIEARGEKLKNLTSLLESVNYKKILARGFALVKSADDKLIPTAAAAKNHSTFKVIFSDGEVNVNL